MLHLPLTNRRWFLTTSAASSGLLLGCHSQPDAAPAAVPVRRDVPLRILLCGEQRWADSLTSAWSAVSAQPLRITLVDPINVDPQAWQRTIVSAIPACDVSIIPSGSLPAIESASGLTLPSEELLSEQGIDAESFLPVIREGLMKFGGRTCAVPLGTIQPVLVMRTDGPASDLEPPRDWESFITVAKQFGDSQVAEPLAGGAAAKMFLWRANGARPPVWLFDRQSLAPVIDTEPYVQVLETMKRCAESYGDKRLTPGEVWSQVATGKRRMAIAWPAAHSSAERMEEAVDCSYSSLPAARTSSDATPQALLDYESPVAIISSHCRQSVAARRFLIWAVGREGTNLIRASISGLTELRSVGHSAPLDSPVTDIGLPVTGNGNATTSSYASQAANELSALSLRPPLQLLEYRKYAAALDAAVLACLDGKRSAQAALTETAQNWAALTEGIGIRAQHQAWRRAQGLRS